VTPPRGVVAALALAIALALALTGCGGSNAGRTTGGANSAGRSPAESPAATGAPPSGSATGGASHHSESGTAVSTEGPAQIARAYFVALGARDGVRACALSSPAQRATYLALPTGARTCAAAVDAVESSLGPAALAPLRAARVRLLSETPNHALVERVGATDRLQLEKTASGWRVTSGTS
jgi:hypothetical protein